VSYNRQRQEVSIYFILNFVLFFLDCGIVLQRQILKGMIIYLLDISIVLMSILQGKYENITPA